MDKNAPFAPSKTRWLVLLVAVLGGVSPAAGLKYIPGRRCPLMTALLHKAKHEGIVLDVGANGGCEMTTALSHGRRVVGVECLASAYNELLQAEEIINNPNATLLHVCAGNSTRMAELNLASDSSSLIEANVASGLEFKKVPKAGRTRESVVLVPLDELLPVQERVAVIKVDVQGLEYEVLQGLLRTIRRDHPVIGYEDSPDFEKHGTIDWKELGYFCERHGQQFDIVCTPTRRG